MVQFQFDNYKNNTDLNMYHCGIEDCEPSHSFGPAVRDHYLIHYILRGKGFFKIGEKVYHLEKGQGFLICPERITYYEAHSADPWLYCWVGFNGFRAEYYLKQAGITFEEPIFTYDRDTAVSDCIMQMIDTYNSDSWNETKVLSLLYLFLSHLIDSKGVDGISRQMENRKELYVRKVIEYIEMNYSRRIRIWDIAGHIGLDRSYLGSLFKEYLQMSIQQFLLEYRINKACELMKEKSLTMSDISRSVGYEDPLLFSKMFKKVKGKSPRKYRGS